MNIFIIYIQQSNILHSHIYTFSPPWPFPLSLSLSSILMPFIAACFRCHYSHPKHGRLVQCLEFTWRCPNDRTPLHACWHCLTAQGKWYSPHRCLWYIIIGCVQYRRPELYYKRFTIQSALVLFSFCDVMTPMLNCARFVFMCLLSYLAERKLSMRTCCRNLCWLTFDP